MASKLKLIIEKGPRNGETLEFNPKLTIRLGRLVKGNNLTIKDSGISSNHLTIKFDSDSCNWVITDLDSSNGTILNSNKIQPLSPFKISDGDSIKIGELTLIRVEFVEIGDEIGSRRCTRSRAGGKIESYLGENGSNLGGEVRVRVLEGDDGEKGAEVEKEGKKGRGRGRPKKVVALEESDLNVVKDVKAKVVEDVTEKVEDVKAKAKAVEDVKGRGRGRPKKVVVLEESDVNVVNVKEVVEDVKAKVMEDVTEKVEDVKGRGRGKPKKVSALKERNCESNVKEAVENLKGKVVEDVKGNEEGGVSTRMTRSSKKRGGELLSVDMVLPVKRTRRGKNAGKVLMGKVEEEEELNMGGSSEVENVSVSENKRTGGGRGRKKIVEVKKELEDDGYDVLVEETRRDLSGMEGSEKVELREQPCERPPDVCAEQSVVEERASDDVSEVRELGGSLCVREQPCDKPLADTAQQKEVEDKMNENLPCEGPVVVSAEQKKANDDNSEVRQVSPCVREQPCPEPMAETAQQNEVEDKMNDNSLEIKATEQVEGSLYELEQPCANPRINNAQHDEFLNEDVLEVEADAHAGGSSSINDQPCSTMLNQTDELNEQKDEGKSNVLEIEVPEHAGGSACAREQPRAEPTYDIALQVDSVVGTSLVGEESPESDLALDQVTVECEMRRDLLEMEDSGRVELREQPCEGSMATVSQLIIEEEKVSSDVSQVGQVMGSLCDREQPCAELMDETSQQNKGEDQMNEDLLGIKVPEQVGGSLYEQEKPSGDPTSDTAHHDKLVDNMNGNVLEVKVDAHEGVSLSSNEQLSSEMLEETDQSNALKDGLNCIALKVDVPEHAGSSPCAREQPIAEPTYDTVVQDESTKGACHVKKRTSESNLVVGDQEMEECEEIPKETSSCGEDTTRGSDHSPDLEKMTLGEWFDYLEVYLPKQIYDATDEIIEDMRKRAKQFDEFMLEQQKEKGKLPLVT